MTKHLGISIIIPTYTGADTIRGCLDSVLAQTHIDFKGVEVVVVIDGPNKILEDIVNSYKQRFSKQNITYRVKRLESNEGRFIARLVGAKLAHHDTLLFLDDRIHFETEYVRKMIQTEAEIVIPNVMETVSENFISRCLYLLRRQIYGKEKFGTKFESYFITNKNFEASPKGTTSLLVPKNIFINACSELQKSAQGKYTNEDTKLFKSMLSSGHSLYRSGEVNIRYQPRKGALNELRHIYHRGPRFVDYYLKPQTRFFHYLILGLFLSIFGILLNIFWLSEIWRIELVFAAVVSVLISIKATEKPSDVLIMLTAVPLVVVSFTLGVYKGIIVQILRKSNVSREFNE